MAILRIIAKSIQRGEATVREQFPPLDTTRHLSAADVAKATAPPPDPQRQAPAESPADDPPPDDAQRRIDRMHALFGEAGLGTDATRPRRLKVMGLVLDQPVTTSKDLTADQRELVIAALERWQRNGDLERAEECAQEEAAQAQMENERAAEGGDQS